MKLIIRGGQTLSGDFTPVGNKNAALPMLAAALLTEQPITLRNLPRIKDVMVMLELLEELGVDVSLRKNTVTLCAANLKSARPDPERCRRVRGSILLAGPLLTRFREVNLAPPGGDVIGRRRIDTHFYGLTKLGAHITTTQTHTLSRTELVGTDILLDEASVTATENIVMAATVARGKTTIFNGNIGNNCIEYFFF